MVCANFNYDLKIFNDDNNQFGDLNLANRLEYSRVKNDIGVAILELPLTKFDYTLFQKDTKLEIWKRINQSDILVGDTAWFLRSIEVSKVDNTIELTFLDTISLLGRRINAWWATDGFDYPSHFNQALDDMIKYVFCYNFITDAVIDPLFHSIVVGPLGPTLSQPSPAGINAYGGSLTGVNNHRPFNMTFDVFKSKAPIKQVQMAWDNCLKIFQDCADNSTNSGTNLWFDLVYTPQISTIQPTYTLKTWTDIRGQDYTWSNSINPIILSEENGNLRDVIYTIDWTDEATIIYAGGEGDNELRIIGSASDGDFSNQFYPIEKFINAQDVSVPDAADNEAAVRLNQLKAKQIITGDIIANNDFLLKYNFGDKVTVVFDNVFFNTEIKEFSVEVTPDGEEITIPLEESI